MNNYINIPKYTTFNEILNKNFSLSATQYKSLNIKNKNTKQLRNLLDRDLLREDLGVEVGSDSYVEKSQYKFIKTKALQKESYLLDINKESIISISPKKFINMNLKKDDILISKDSNVGEVVILDKDYPNSMLSSAIYKLPISTNKYYVLAFIKSELFRQQIDFLVPRGSTIRHGKTKFLDCLIPFPNNNVEYTIKYVEMLMKAIIDKELKIRNKHNMILKMIEDELINNQSDNYFKYSLPTLKDIMNYDRMDSCLYSKKFKENEFLINNYKYGFSRVSQLGYEISRGQNLQVSNIGKSIHSKIEKEGYYTLYLPKFLSIYGTVNEVEYIGNSNELKTLKRGELIFGAEGNEKGRSYVILDEKEKIITNIHGITLTPQELNINKSVFIKLFLDYYRSKGMIDDYAVGGNGGSLAIKYWDYLKFPNFPNFVEDKITSLYNNEIFYDYKKINFDNFLIYDSDFNNKAGIYQIDKSLKHFKKLLEKTINKIINDDIIDDFFI